MKRMLAGIMMMMCVCMSAWALVPVQSFSSDVSKTVKRRGLIFNQGTSQRINWRFTQGDPGIDLTAATNGITFVYSPSGNAWQVSVTGGIVNATNGECFVAFTPTQLATNSNAGAFNWRLEATDGSDILGYAYGGLTINYDPTDVSTNTLPTNGVKGDIFYVDAGLAVTRLGIGTNGQRLVVASSGIPGWETGASSIALTNAAYDYNAVSNYLDVASRIVTVHFQTNFYTTALADALHLSQSNSLISYTDAATNTLRAAYETADTSVSNSLISYTDAATNGLATVAHTGDHGDLAGLADVADHAWAARTNDSRAWYLTGSIFIDGASQVNQICVGPTNVVDALGSAAVSIIVNNCGQHAALHVANLCSLGASNELIHGINYKTNIIFRLDGDAEGDARVDLTDRDGVTKFRLNADANNHFMRLYSDSWIGIGSAAGRIDFDNNTIDEINFLNARSGFGTNAPTHRMQLANGVFYTQADATNNFVDGTTFVADGTVSSNAAAFGQIATATGGINNAFLNAQHTDAVLRDGSRGLTAGWNIGTQALNGVQSISMDGGGFLSNVGLNDSTSASAMRYDTRSLHKAGGNRIADWAGDDFTVTNNLVILGTPTENSTDAARMSDLTTATNALPGLAKNNNWSGTSNTFNTGYFDEIVFISPTGTNITMRGFQAFVNGSNGVEFIQTGSSVTNLIYLAF